MKGGVGLRHFPREFAAAWLVVATLADSLALWIAQIGLGVHQELVWGAWPLRRPPTPIGLRPLKVDSFVYIWAKSHFTTPAKIVK